MTDEELEKMFDLANDPTYQLGTEIDMLCIRMDRLKAGVRIAQLLGMVEIKGNWHDGFKITNGIEHLFEAIAKKDAFLGVE